MSLLIVLLASKECESIRNPFLSVKSGVSVVMSVNGFQNKYQ